MEATKTASISHLRSQCASREPIRPFVCGTFRDFHEERDFLNELVFPKLNKLCQERGTRFLPVDLRWDSKQGQSTSDHILRVCLDNVERCAPFSSLTELEVVQASFRKKYDYGYFYFRDPEHLQDKLQNIESEDEKEKLLADHSIESEYAARKLRELKQQVIDTELPVRHFCTLDELGDLVLQDWSAIINSLYSPIDKSVFQSTNTECFHQWSLHETVGEAHRQIFQRTPRIREISDVMSVHAEVEQGIQRKTSMALTHVLLGTFMTSLPGGERDTLPPILTLVGERGSGKSALVSNWLKQFGVSHPEVVLISHHVGYNANSSDVTNFMRRCTRELRAQYLGSDVSDTIDNQDLTDFRRVTEAFRSAVTLGPSVLVIDGACEFGKSHDLPAYEAKELRWLPETMPESCRIIITTIKPDITYRALRGRRDAYFIEISDLLDTKAKRTLLEECVGSNYPKYTDDAHYAKISSSALSHLPFYYVSLANEIRLLGSMKNAERQLDMYVHATSIGELWKQIIRRWTHDYGWLRPAASRSPVPSIKAQASRDRMNSGWVADAMRLFSVSRNGLTEEEMLGALKVMGYANNYSISTAYWSVLRLVAQNALLELPSGILTFSHESIRSAVDIALLTNLTSPSHERMITPLSEAWERQKQQCHVVLANFFSKLPNSSRVAEELPWQQMMCGQIDNLSRTLVSPGLFVQLTHDIRTENSMLDLLCYWKVLTAKGMKPDELFLQMARDAQERVADDEARVSSAVSKSEDHLMVESMFYKSEEDTLTPMQLAILLFYTGKLLMGTENYSAAEELLLTAYKVGYPVASVHDLEVVCQLQSTLGDLSVAMGALSKAGQWYTGALKVSSEMTRVQSKRDHEAMIGRLLSRLALTRMGVDVSVGPLEDQPKPRVTSRTSRPRTTSGHSRGDSERVQRVDSTVGPLLKEAVKHIELSVGFTEMSTAVFYMGLHSMKQRQWSDARKALETALGMRQQWYGTTHPLVAEIVDLLGTLCWNDVNEGRELSEAEGLYREALRMREQALGNSHLLVASTLFKLGKLLRSKNTKDATREAKALFQRSLDIRTSKLGVYHSASKAVRRDLMSLEVADVAVTFGTSAAIKEQPMLMLRDYKEQLMVRSISKLAMKSS